MRKLDAFLEKICNGNRPPVEGLPEPGRTEAIRPHRADEGSDPASEHLLGEGSRALAPERLQRLAADLAADPLDPEPVVVEVDVSEGRAVDPLPDEVSKDALELLLVVRPRPVLDVER